TNRQSGVRIRALMRLSSSRKSVRNRTTEPAAGDASFSVRRPVTPLRASARRSRSSWERLQSRTSQRLTRIAVGAAADGGAESLAVLFSLIAGIAGGQPQT